MKIERVENEELCLRLSENQLCAIFGSLREIGDVIDDFEFYARVGAKKSEINELCVRIKEEMEANSIDI